MTMRTFMLVDGWHWTDDNRTSHGPFLHEDDAIDSYIDSHECPEMLDDLRASLDEAYDALEGDWTQ